MNAPLLLFQDWAAISGMHPRAMVWNGCLTGNSGQSMHTLHSFPTLREWSTNTTFLCLHKREAMGGGWGRSQGTDCRVQKQMWLLIFFSPSRVTF